MGKYTLRTVAKRLEFEDQFIPDNTVWKECNTNKDPFDSMFLLEGQYPIYTSFFETAGLKLSFDPLLLDFLRNIRFRIG